MIGDLILTIFGIMIGGLDQDKDWDLEQGPRIEDLYLVIEAPLGHPDRLHEGQAEWGGAIEGHPENFELF